MAARTEIPSSTNLPAHAIRRLGGYGSECARGYRREREHCVQVQVPSHAFLDYFGHAWECERGYQQEGNRCVSVQPDQASLARTDEAATGAAFSKDELAQLATDVYTNHEALHDWQTIAHLRRQLQQTGYDPGPIDGLPGTAMVAVVKPGTILFSIRHDRLRICGPRPGACPGKAPLFDNAIEQGKEKRRKSTRRWGKSLASLTTSRTPVKYSLTWLPGAPRPRGGEG
jgi:hypothetical protein